MANYALNMLSISDVNVLQKGCFKPISVDFILAWKQHHCFCLFDLFFTWLSLYNILRLVGVNTTKYMLFDQ